jgi:sugar phosphate isomerase/epimerase
MNHREWRRREFLRATVYTCVAATGLNAAERNIYWGLGLVTWKGKSTWPEILHDVDAAGFDGVEPFTAKFLNDEAMAELAQLLPKYKNLRMSSVYWSGPFNVPSEHDRLIDESHRFWVI